MDHLSQEDENNINDILQSAINQIKNEKTVPRKKKEDNFFIGPNKNPEMKDERERANEGKNRPNLQMLLNEIKANQKPERGGKTQAESTMIQNEKICLKKFSDNDWSGFKDDLKSIQTNIEKIEKRLFDNNSINGRPLSPLSTLTSQTYNSGEYFPKGYEKKEDYHQSDIPYPNYDYDYANKTKDDILTYTRNILNRSSHHNLTDNKLIDTLDSNKQLHDSQFKVNSSTHSNFGYDNNNPRLFQEVIDKDKTIHNLKITLSNERAEKADLVSAILQERDKNKEIEKLLRIAKNDADGMCEMKEKYYQLEKNYNCLAEDYHNSENIRLDQGKIIKTLQEDLDFMRNNCYNTISQHKKNICISAQEDAKVKRETKPKKKKLKKKTRTSSSKAKPQQNEKVKQKEKEKRPSSSKYRKAKNNFV